MRYENLGVQITIGLTGSLCCLFSISLLLSFLFNNNSHHHHHHNSSKSQTPSSSRTATPTDELLCESNKQRRHRRSSLSFRWFSSSRPSKATERFTKAFYSPKQFELQTFILLISCLFLCIETVLYVLMPYLPTTKKQITELGDDRSLHSVITLFWLPVLMPEISVLILLNLLVSGVGLWFFRVYFRNKQKAVERNLLSHSTMSNYRSFLRKENKKKHRQKKKQQQTSSTTMMKPFYQQQQQQQQDIGSPSLSEYTEQSQEVTDYLYQMDPRSDLERANKKYAALRFINRHGLSIYMLFNVFSALLWYGLSVAMSKFLIDNYKARVIFSSAVTTCVSLIILLLCIVVIYSVSYRLENIYFDHDTVVVVRRFKKLAPIFLVIIFAFILIMLLWLCEVPYIRCLRLQFPFQDATYKCQTPKGTDVPGSPLTIETLFWYLLFVALPLLLVSVAFRRIPKQQEEAMVHLIPYGGNQDSIETYSTGPLLSPMEEVMTPKTPKSPSVAIVGNKTPRTLTPSPGDELKTLPKTPRDSVLRHSEPPSVSVIAGRAMTLQIPPRKDSNSSNSGVKYVPYEQNMNYFDTTMTRQSNEFSNVDLDEDEHGFIQI